VPLPRAIAKLNRVGLNRLTRHIAPWAPGFGVVVHRGRKSGKTFRTPINVFVRDNSYVFALTYGPQSDWVRNVLAAGGCELVTRRTAVQLTGPRLEHNEVRNDLPLVVRTILRITKVHDYLLLERAA
jgi:deazaflavin-dependent oxidoreductase (nitroreductase family)